MFADDNFKFAENVRKIFKRVESTVGKGEIARYEQFLLFPQCFQKICTADVIGWTFVEINISLNDRDFVFITLPIRVPRGSVVRCLTRNPGVLGSSRTRSSEFFRGSVLGQDTSEPSTGETQESMNNVICCRDMTEILLKAA